MVKTQRRHIEQAAAVVQNTNAVAVYPRMIGRLAFGPK